MKNVLKYLNPMHHLGEQHYSILFPLVVNLLLCVSSEIYVYQILKNPLAVGMYIIFLNVALIIYFSFRDGIHGGLITSAISILYYFYIIVTRHYAGQQFTASIETVIGLTVLYILLATIIGWLKHRIDTLIEREADEKRRLEAIIQQLPVGVLITDSKGRLTQRNKRIDQILGTKLPIGFHIGKDSLSNKKIYGKLIKPSESPLFQALKSGKPLVGKEFLYTNRKGKQLSLQVSAAPILNKKRKTIATASIISDITRQKELEHQKDDFLGIASHELKTPVTSIKAYEQVLQAQFSKKGDIKAVEQLQKMDTQVNKLTNLIGDLLDVTKIQSRKLEFHPNYFDFNELVNEIVEELKLTTNHKLITKLNKTKTIYADRERVGQVITNLITNAIKYSPHSKNIYVKTATNNNTVTLCIKDFGVGIPKSKHNKVFEQFFRVSGPKNNTFPGLGLGLYISSEIIKREGGRIWVESSEGKGSSFYVSLPMKMAVLKQKNRAIASKNSS